MEEQNLADSPEEMSQEEKEREAYVQRVQGIAAKLQLGADQERIVADLVDEGLERDSAQALVTLVYNMLKKQAERSKVTSGSLVKAVVGGFLAAVIVGMVWGKVTVATDREFGIIAWLVGLAVGFSILISNSGKRGTPFQLIGVAFSVFGILFGKYYTFYLVMNQAIADGVEGTEGIAELPLLGIATIMIFFMSLPEMLGGFDLLWVVFAVWSCWKMLALKGQKISLPDEPQPAAGSFDNKPLDPG